MKKIIFCILFITALICKSCKEVKNEQTTIKVVTHSEFKVSKANTQMVIDGKRDELDWNRTEAATFNNFYHYDAINKADDKQKTTFRMLWDDEFLYVFFESEDKYLTAREKVRDGAPYFDDCAEIFLSPAPEILSTHMGFEVNLYKTSNDFLFMTDFYNGQPGVLKAFNPEFKVETTLNGTINDNSDIDKGWTMEMAIPLKLFFKIDTYAPVKAGAKWTFLAVRQERNEVEGNRRITSSIFPIDEEKIDVHEPSKFGFLHFIE
ncbi:hypothetical protein AXE80_06180 [Wenyingzhuangia fucanilytica]|uniref:Carbohydrate-binding domain-containing protein n=1 Tax=Wenyingzhuangia fucanilytica TaxID=1790137 RepID=A0A1B1Y533_9FLAO|nr:carbohydrate-binding family 9-like protein [Wenyingzhuangia fucanilytica]ANW95891.1 hypothetical protein AXE80_06180 [Wenyingzhuangia fucanilytica]